MKLTTGISFGYTFWFDHISGDTGANDEKKIREIIQWCADNCNYQWVIYNNPVSYAMDSRTSLSVTFYSGSKNKYPLTDYSYPPAQLTRHLLHVISFEDETDAVAFKLKWCESNGS